MIPIYWINLEQSVDRRNKMIDQFLKQGLINRRIDAIKHDKPILGCSLSHIKAIHRAWMDGNELAIVCEDDVDFSEASKTFTLINNILQTLPDSIKADWDIIQIQYTEPHFCKGLNNYLLGVENISEVENRLIKGYLYGSVAYLINRKGMVNFLNKMTKMDVNDKDKYIVTANFDHPRAGAEELIYRYVNTYMSVFPILNYQVSESLVNPSHEYFLSHEWNRVLTNSNYALLNPDNYKIIQNKKIYELRYDLHWFNGGKEEVEEVIDDIFIRH